MNKHREFSRRAFIAKTSAAAAFTIVPRHVLGGRDYTAPSDKVNIAGIGIGNQGGMVIQNIATPDVPIIRRRTQEGLIWRSFAGIKPAGEAEIDYPFWIGDPGIRHTVNHANIYAMCDVDSKYAGHILAGYPKAKVYEDYRKMIDQEKEIDAVVIATPDHTHGVIAAYAMHAGKHVFVEKPLAKTIHEVRFLKELARKTGVVTQMGNQGHNNEGTLQTVEWIQSGVIGKVKEVQMYSSAPIWKQGYLKRPAGVEVPGSLNYDLWLGPAPEKSYHPDTTHFAWRGLWDYGTGAMGDMGAHTFDAPIWALKLGMPTKIQATSTPFSSDYMPQAESVSYEFPARGDLPPVKVSWSDGGIIPSRPPGLEPDRALREALYHGDKGMLMHGTHGAAPELVPHNPDMGMPEKSLKRPANIYVDFIDAIKEGRKAANDFEVSAKLTEIMLLTNIAVVSQLINRILEYDSETMTITNCPEANNYFHYEYRKGWSL